MKNKEQAMVAYEAPKVEVIEVEVEQGFAGSNPIDGGMGENQGMGGNGSVIIP